MRQATTPKPHHSINTSPDIFIHQSEPRTVNNHTNQVKNKKLY